jgi:membrane associated rhomboid family serine protease
MGYRDYPKRSTSNWSASNPLIMLVIINVMFFILLHFIKSIYNFSRLPEGLFMQHVHDWFVVPGKASLFLQRPWVLFTAMFSQMNLILMISNMFWLWTFGYILQDLIGERRVFPLYFYSGLTASLVFLFMFNAIPQYGTLASSITYSGATASILGVAVAATVISPQYRLFPMIGNGIPLWLLTVAFMIIDLASISASSYMFFVHGAAGLIGFLFARALLRGSDWSAWMNNLYERITHLFQPRGTTRKRMVRKEEVFYNTRGKQPFVRKGNVTQQRIDEILDKINQKGYQKLTEEERDLLRRASEGEI